MKKVLVVVDMQNDFVGGVLGTPEAKRIAPKVAEYIKNFDGDVFYTCDIHLDNEYLNTQEGRKLPVKYCIVGTVGSELTGEVKGVLESKGIRFLKNQFACLSLISYLRYEKNDVYFCGVCTDICVVSNALLLKAHYPENEIYVVEDLCAGTTKENHDAAITTMRNCQINIIESGLKE